MEKQWKQFERLVAAIQQALSGADAAIEWSEDIGGREFDVTVRFSKVAYNYLTVVEAKDYLVPVKEVEAFFGTVFRFFPFPLNACQRERNVAPS